MDVGGAGAADVGDGALLLGAPVGAKTPGALDDGAGAAEDEPEPEPEPELPDDPLPPDGGLVAAEPAGQLGAWRG